jgi:hypothetical protein
MPTPPKLITYEAYDDEIEKLLKLLGHLSIPVPGDAQLAREALVAFKFLYYSTFQHEAPPTFSAIDNARIQVGLGDLATKINKAWSKAGDQAIRPHLEKMVKGAVRMNERNSVIDDAANKTCELYVACLALGLGLTARLDHPVKSSGGRNPDVIIDYQGRSWSIAVKTIHGYSSKTIFDAVDKAAHQVQQSGTVGIPLVNLTNRIELSPQNYNSIGEANAALCDAMVRIVQRLRDDIADDDWLATFKNKLARPVVAFMAQLLTSFHASDSKEIFLPVRQLVALTVPPLPTTNLTLSGLDLDALRLITDLNVELQASP